MMDICKLNINLHWQSAINYLKMCRCGNLFVYTNKIGPSENRKDNSALPYNASIAFAITSKAISINVLLCCGMTL